MFNNDRTLIILTYGGRGENTVTIGPHAPKRPDQEQVFVRLETGRLAWRHRDGSYVNAGWVKSQLKHEEVADAIREALGYPLGSKVSYHRVSDASTTLIDQMEGRRVFPKGHKPR